MLDFNASLNDVVPVSPMLLPVEVLRKEKSELLMDAFLCFLSFANTIKPECHECCIDLQ